MSEQCKETVYTGTWSRPSRCSRNSAKDGFCKQHHPESKAEGAKKSEEAYQAKQKQSDWYLLSKARERIAELEALLKRAKPVYRKTSDSLVRSGHAISGELLYYRIDSNYMREVMGNE